LTRNHTAKIAKSNGTNVVTIYVQVIKLLSFANSQVRKDWNCSRKKSNLTCDGL